MRSDGTGEAVRLTNNANDQYGRSFSPDGTKLLYTQANPPSDDLWVLTLEDSRSDHPKVVAAQPFLQTPFTEAEPTLSPDGKWVAYISDESGRNEVYVRPFEGAQGKWAVSTTGGWHPVWSRNERQLFYGSADGINVVNFTSSGQTFSAGKPQVWSNKTVEDFDMAPDGKRCIVIQKETPVQQGPAQLTFLVNFFDELRRRVDAAQ